MYCEINDITKDLNKTILFELINDENRDTDLIDLDDENDVATARAIEQITAADVEIDTYLRSRYDLPITGTIPERLKQISKDISIYNLYKRRHKTDMPEDIVGFYKDRIKDLKEIQKGSIDIGVPEAPQNMADEIKVNKTSEDKVFSDDLLDQY